MPVTVTGRRPRHLHPCRGRHRVPDAVAAADLDAYVVYVGFDRSPQSAGKAEGAAEEAEAEDGRQAEAELSGTAVSSIVASA